MRDEFSVYWWDPLGGQYTEDTFVSLEKAVIITERLIKSLAAKLGTLTRVIITDGGDCIVLEWIYGKGVVFPQTEVKANPVSFSISRSPREFQ